jgi:acetyl-CoA C-acetyltransferase
MDQRTPVVVGVGQITNRRPNIAHPLELMSEASRRADADSGGRALEAVDSLQFIQLISWRSPAPATLLADELGLDLKEQFMSTVGGSTPQTLMNSACAQIAAGEIEGALIVGCEALDSMRRAQKDGIGYDRGRSDTLPPDEVRGDDRSPVRAEELQAGLVAPASIYPMFEQALARRDGRTPDEQRAFLGGLMAPFTDMAASHPDTAWFPRSLSPSEISDVSDDNRMVAEPYTKNLNSILQVDMAAAVIVLSAGAAEAAGVPKDRWVFPWSGAKCDDVWFLAERPLFDRCVAMEEAGRAAFSAADVGIDDIGHIDLYSCFPSAVQMGADAIGLSLDDSRGLTLTGGLPYFGGPGNNYVTHSIAALVDRLRANPNDLGLVTGISWYVTKNAIGIYSCKPPPNAFRVGDTADAQARIDATAIEVAAKAEGDAVVDAFTVEHSKEAGPVRAPIYARLEDGRRIVAVPADPAIPTKLSGTCLIGETVRVRQGDASLVYEL